MSFRSNQTLSVWTVEPITHNSICFLVLFPFFVLFPASFPTFWSIKMCGVCVCGVLCQEAHASISYEYAKLELHSVVVAPWVPNVSPSGAASNHFFPLGATWRMPPRAYAGVFWCNKTGSALSLLSWRQIHNFFSSQLETFLLIGDSGLQEFWQQPSTSLHEHYVLTHN